MKKTSIVRCGSVVSPSAFLIPLFAALLLLITILTTKTTTSISCSAFLISPSTINNNNNNNNIKNNVANRQFHHRVIQQHNRKIGSTAAANDDNEKEDDDKITIDRRRVLSTILATTASLSLSSVFYFSPSRADALVKGVAPPPKKSVGEKLKCTNVEECQDMAEKRDDLRAQEEAGGPPPLVTKGGVKYRDISLSSPDDDNNNNNNNNNNNDKGEDDSNTNTNTNIISAQEGDDVSIYFKVLKLGKRSYDGLSGEGTVVFSRGYGLEDDEDKPAQKSFSTFIGSTSNIPALNEALVGMKLNGLRRFAILPQKGWERQTKACDGGPGGGGAGGDIRTDYVVVPTATMVQQEVCLDNTKLPFPSTYAQQRRMAQRFDQSLIMEVQLVSIDNKNK
ncbi:MAG: hypothetical protein ACI90V_011987, partial [Bacillariaceae sp.]